MQQKRVVVPTAVRMLTVDEVEAHKLRVNDVASAFVRFRPTPGASEQAVEDAVAYLKRLHPAALRVLPRQQGKLAIHQGQPVQPAQVQPLQPGETARTLLMGLVDKSSSARKIELRELLNALADKEGV